MNLIQSYFNNNITKADINYSGGYLSAEINWLSMAYSCLLLKRNNPDKRLIFYGNETIVHLFKDLFKLPYDEYRIIECTGEYAKWFYCWPKIVTYQEQNTPFIHIDTDVFMWKPMPHRLLQAPLVAQHLERDSNFYMDVYRQIGIDRVQLPGYLEACNDGKYINSYNAGLLGGNDITFFKRYLKEILDFVNSNRNCFLQSDRRFLYNVVFEQWLFYGLTKEENKVVDTFYKDAITDFDMEKAKVSQQILSLEELEYLHVMEYKDNIRCNRFIAYKMQSEFPDEYDRILAVCKEYGVKSSIYSSYAYGSSLENDVFVRSKKLRETCKLSDKALEEIIKFESITENLLLQFQCCRKEGIEKQKAHHELLEQIRICPKSISLKRMGISPELKIVDANSKLVELLLYKVNRELPKDAVILLVYNATFNRVDEFIWTRQRLELLFSLMRMGDVSKFLTERSDDTKINELATFVKQCLFDGIITFI